MGNAIKWLIIYTGKNTKQILLNSRIIDTIRELKSINNVIEIRQLSSVAFNNLQ